MEGIFSSLEPEVKNGFFTEYYESGFKKSDGEYYNDKKRGIFHIYKDTLGYLWETATYKNDKLNGPFSVYAKNGLQYKGSFENGKLVKYDFGNAANLFSSQNINDTKNNQVSENRPKLSDILSRNYRKYASEKFRSTSSTVTLSYEVDSDGVLGNVSVESGDSTEQSEMVLNSLKEYCLGRGKDQGAKITGTLSVTFPQMNVRWNYKIGSNYNSMLYFSIDTNAKSSAKKNSQVSLATDIVSEKPRFVRQSSMTYTNTGSGQSKMTSGDEYKIMDGNLVKVKPLSEYIKEAYAKTSMAKDSSVSGLVMLKFEVGESDKPQNIEVLWGNNKKLLDLVIKAVKKYPEWRGGGSVAKPIKRIYRVSVTFPAITVVSNSNLKTE